MGSPISRKAILGGKCVDTGEYLGPPLTALVDTFVSVADHDTKDNTISIRFIDAKIQ
ncbi:hypothetical protein COOONC_11245 [Cooperia oncophora]